MPSSARRAVFLDRDGVLNRAVVHDGKPYPPASVAELEIVPEAPSSLSSLRERGFLLIVVTNQPDVGRGKQRREVVEGINDELRRYLPLDDVCVCYHDDAEACACRKPAPGLLLEAAARHGVELPRSFMVGDRWRDVEAGLRAGCKAVWIDCAYAETQPERYDARVTSLREATNWILQLESA